MPANPIEVQGTVISVPCLTVASVIEISSVLWERSRKELIEDLEDSNASEPTKLETLREHRETKGHTFNVVKWALTASGAKAVIEKACDGFPDEFQDFPVERLIEIAMGTLGVDWEELSSKKSAEGNQKAPGVEGT
tara:strand:- start:359 stop:766 length:408 start_codon:yes stop_codon:yes gene_type:complete